MTAATSSAATSSPAGTRDRLLDAAATMFYRQGIGVGVEALCQAAGVSKRSMYQLFDTKDDVVAASLDRSAAAYWETIGPSDDDRRPPRALILHVFEKLEEQTQSADYCGCPFVATAVELKNPDHPASIVARKHKDAMTAFFQREAERGRAHDPALLAQQLTIAFDGASARAVMHASALHGVAIATATALLDHAGLDDEPLQHSLGGARTAE